MKSNNKGIAMVTVVIATMFIGILASSLIYMAYLNYITKTMRYKANDTFYSAEFVLDELSSSLIEEKDRTINSVFMNADGTSSATSTDIIKAVRTLCGGSDSAAVWDPGCLANLVNVSGTNAAGHINIIFDSPEPVAGRTQCDHDCGAYKMTTYSTVNYNYLCLHNVRITAQELDASGVVKYESSITTHITFSFGFQSNAGMDVNDFSLLSDNPVIYNGGNLIYSGNLLIRSVTGDPALKLTGSTIMTFNGENGIIYGDVEIGAGSTFVVNGNLRIIGNIKVDGTLIVNDENAGCSGSYESTDDESGETIIGDGVIVYKGRTDSDAVSQFFGRGYSVAPELDAGVIGGLFAPEMYIFSVGQYGNFGTQAPLRIKLTPSLDKFTPDDSSHTKSLPGVLFTLLPPSTWGDSNGNAGTAGGIGAQYNTQDVTHNSAGSLVLLLSNPNNTNSGALKGTYSDCSIISAFSTVTLGGDSTQGANGGGKPNFTKMDLIPYRNSLTSIFYGSKTPENNMPWEFMNTAVNASLVDFYEVKMPILNEWGNPTGSYADAATYAVTSSDVSKINNARVGFGGSASDYASILAEVKASGAQAYMNSHPGVYIHEYSVSSDYDTDPWGYPNVAGKEQRYAIYANNKNIVPLNTLFSGTTRSYLQGIFDAVDDNASTNGNIYFSYWIKE